MKFVFYTNSVSPHQIPLAEELVRILGEDEYRYIHTLPLTRERIDLGWSKSESNWIISEKESHVVARNILLEAECLMCSVRDFDLIKQRAMRGLLSVYVSERWFKPPFGMLRLLSPRYFYMASRFVRMLSRSSSVLYFPMGIHAARDMARLCGLLRGDIRCLFWGPELRFGHEPGGRICRVDGKNGEKYCLDKMRMWGYFVAGHKGVGGGDRKRRSVLRILWVGRYLRWKNVDTIIKAVGECSRKGLDIVLDLYGRGREEFRLKELAAKFGDAVCFHSAVSISDVRKLMRTHDVYVLASNGAEGWGAVVNEAIEEGMIVIGTNEAGSSATILPKKMLFPSGDWRILQKLLEDIFKNGLSYRSEMTMQLARVWSPSYAAQVMKKEIIHHN